MKVCLVAHGYPPELVGGTENAVQSLARGLARRGHAVVVVAGSLQHGQGFRRSSEEEAAPPGGGAPIRVHRIHRADLYFDHWQKSASARASAAFRDILREERPDLVHVHHWIRLSRDLVHRSALERIPALVTLHDLWTSCLVTFRVRPDTHEFCRVRLAPSPCLACAALVPPRTPWMSFESQGVALLERSADIRRELEIARAVLAPTRAHAQALAGFLGFDLDNLAIRVVPHGRDCALVARAPLPPPAHLGKLVLGCWGHLHRLKGADLILRALRRLREPARVELHLAGSEPDPNFAREVHELAAGLAVRFHGVYAADELGAHAVSAVHAFVSGTRAHESWGLVLDEAVALGLPLVLPRSGAYAERLQERRGALFYDPGSEGALAGVLERLLAEPGLLEDLRRRLPAPGEFTPTVADAVERHLELYREVLAAGPPAAVRALPERELVWKAAEEAWDRALARSSAHDLGLP